MLLNRDGGSAPCKVGVAAGQPLKGAGIGGNVYRKSLLVCNRHRTDNPTVAIEHFFLTYLSVSKIIS